MAGSRGVSEGEGSFSAAAGGDRSHLEGRAVLVAARRDASQGGRPHGA